MLACFNFGLAPLISNAQGSAKPSHSPKSFGPYGGHRWAGIERLTTELNLTPAQAAKIKPIMDDMQSEMVAVGIGSNLTPIQKIAKTNAIQQEEQTEISKMLTPTQTARWKLDRARVPKIRPYVPPPTNSVERMHH
jgi:hypothetical protein